MSALAAGDQVILSGAIAALPLAELPMFGMCQSLVAGPPPSTVVIDWSNGTQTTYNAVDGGPRPVLFKVTASQEASILGTIVRTSIFGDTGGRVQGPVVQQYLLLNPDGTESGELVVVDTPLGFLPTAKAFVIPLTN